MKKIIALDHGNSRMKSEWQVFPSSYIESGYLPSISGDVLKYNDKVNALVLELLDLIGFEHEIVSHAKELVSSRG